jgi:hypothetical protein
MTTTTDINPFYPNGQCDACGHGLRDNASCQNDDCGRYISEDTPERQALALVMEYGYMLAQKDEWELDDNFDTTEALYALYCNITGHKD